MDGIASFWGVAPVSTPLTRQRPELFVVGLGWFEDKDSVFCAMGYVEHGDLGQYMKTYWLKAKTEAKVITSQILEGLVILHGRGICHRNSEPQV